MECDCMESNYEKLIRMTDEEMDFLCNEAVKAAIHRQKVMGFPVARYDVERGEPYLEYPNGERVYER